MRPQMQPPLEQPIGFWTIRAGEAIRSRIRSRLAEVGVSQHEWWVLHQLSRYPGGVDEQQLVETIGPNDTDEAIVRTIDVVAEKGWVTRREGMVMATSAGAERFTVAAEAQNELGVERRRGISDEEYEIAITVLQRTIANVGGDAWHW
ncbi:MarR family winged helix-turn-helix transcriptional regulator [Gordonia sp. DT101]|uniref:MarR family winged helix-turn-helix transcriptional regulator n=1 Tax=Gordonia sp. DT101 TaxID=3416545 RepID=UPI003CF581AA